MGFDLRGVGGTFRCDRWSWAKALDLAVAYGWQPAGTVDPVFAIAVDGTSIRDDSGAWEGGYFTNDYQRVGDADAQGLAGALEESLDDIPDQRSVPDVGMLPIDAVVAMSPLRWFSGTADKRMLRDFIAFCRAGSFVIG